MSIETWDIEPTFEDLGWTDETEEYPYTVGNEYEGWAFWGDDYPELWDEGDDDDNTSI